MKTNEKTSIVLSGQIESAGHAIVKYAGDIAGNYYRTDEPFDIIIHLSPGETPVIEFNTKILPI